MEHSHSHSHTHEHTHASPADWADRAGIWASALCFVHCALMPLFLVLLPGLFVGGDRVHVIMAMVLPLLSLAAFIPGFRQHGEWYVAGIGSVGLALIIVALWSGGWPQESILTMAGSSCLIFAHWRNRVLMNRLCKCPKTPDGD